MIGLDTNVLLRFYLSDDPVQSPQARRVMSLLKTGQPGWVGLVSILEIVWVLKKKGASRDQIADLLDALLSQDLIVVEQTEIVGKAVRRFRFTRCSFADCVLAESARAAGCARMMTFDEIAARDLGMELVTP